MPIMHPFIDGFQRKLRRSMTHLFIHRLRDKPKKLYVSQQQN